MAGYGLGNIFANAVPQVTDQALDVGIENALAGNAMGQIGSLANQVAPIGQALPTGIAQIANPAVQNALPVNALAGIGEASQVGVPNAGTGVFDSWGNFGNAITSDQAGNALDMVGKGYNMYQNKQYLDSARDDQAQARQQSQDVFNRNKKADENRTKLNF